MPTGIRLTVSYDDDPAGAAEALLVVLKRAEPNHTDQTDESEKAPAEAAA
jgi:hypothetical protein